MKGLERMLHTLKMINRSRKNELKYTIVPTMYDRRTHATVTSLRAMRNEYHGEIWPSMIPVDTRLRDASKAGQTISRFDPETRGCHAYTALVKYLLSPHEKQQAALNHD